MNDPTGRIGEWIGGYRLASELARGGMGVVHRGVDPALDRPVAIKVMLGWTAVDHERFRREARALARLRSPHVVAVHAAGEVSGTPYLVMDLVEGESLRGLLRRAGPPPLADALRIARGVAEALRCAHAAGVLHRDLKPDNVLLAPDGTAVLTDFGLARDATDRAERLTTTGEILGTPAYMAPEQANGERAAIGPPTDVYAFGATLFELLTGRAPFIGASLLGILSQVTSDPAPRVRSLDPAIPPALDALVAACLEKDPQARPASADALLAALAGPAPEPRATPAAGRALLAIGGWIAAAGLALFVALRSAPPPDVPSAPAAPSIDVAAERRVSDAEQRASTAERRASAAEQRASDATARADRLAQQLATARASTPDPAPTEASPTGAPDPDPRRPRSGAAGTSPARPQAQHLEDLLLEATTLAQANRRSAAVQFLEQLEPEWTGSAPLFTLRSGLRFQQGDLEGAERDASAALAIDPDATDARVVRVNARHQAGDVWGALADVDRVQALVPTQPGLAVTRAELSLLVGDLPTAHADLERVSHLKGATYLIVLARLRAAEGARRDAHAVLERLSAFGSGAQGASLARAAVLLADGDADGALRELGPAGGTGEAAAVGRYYRGLAHARRDDAAAERELTAALKLLPQFVAARLERGRARLRRGDATGATDDATAVIASAPEATPAREQARRLLDEVLAAR